MAFVVRASSNTSHAAWIEHINLLNPCSALTIEKTLGSRLSCRTPTPRKFLVAMGSNSVQSVALMPSVESRNAGTSIMVDFSFHWFFMKLYVILFRIWLYVFGQECLFIAYLIGN